MAEMISDCMTIPGWDSDKISCDIDSYIHQNDIAIGRFKYNYYSCMVPASRYPVISIKLLLTQ